VNIPFTLKGFGIKESDIEALAESGIEQKRLLARSPKPYRLDDVRNVYRAAYEGDLKFG
jgi:alcohol dehydrogenase class IV